MYGLSDDEVSALLSGQFEKFSPPEQALHLADALAETPTNVSDALYAELRTHFPKSSSSSWPQMRRRRTSARAGIACSMSGAMRCTASSPSASAQSQAGHINGMGHRLLAPTISREPYRRVGAPLLPLLVSTKRATLVRSR